MQDIGTEQGNAYQFIAHERYIQADLHEVASHAELAGIFGGELLNRGLYIRAIDQLLHLYKITFGLGEMLLRLVQLIRIQGCCGITFRDGNEILDGEEVVDTIQRNTSNMRIGAICSQPSADRYQDDK